MEKLENSALYIFLPANFPREIQISTICRVSSVIVTYFSQVWLVQDFIGWLAIKTIDETQKLILKQVFSGERARRV
jgi:hypothetical protein